MLTIEEFVKKLPEDQQRRIARGERLFKYIIKQRCQQPEKLAGDTARTSAEASPKVRRVAGK